jgi:hypothetical protein
MNKVSYKDPINNHPKEWEHFVENARYYPGGWYCCITIGGSEVLQSEDTAELFQQLLDNNSKK